MALVSTLAGNLFIVDSIADIIVIGVAAKRGVEVDWWHHLRIGVPVTVATDHRGRLAGAAAQHLNQGACP